MRRNTLILVLPGSLLHADQPHGGFPDDLLRLLARPLSPKPVFRLEPSFFHESCANIRSPIRPPRIVEGASVLWFQMAAYTYRDRNNVFRNTIIQQPPAESCCWRFTTRLQRYANMAAADAPKTTTRQTELFHRFVALVHEHSAQQREVSFYADKLCISTRYLSTIVRNIAHSSAKEFIDRSVLLEIKMLLQSTDLSVQEIAYRLHFPDQSYLGRYFKKHTGESPTEYRNTKK